MPIFLDDLQSRRQELLHRIGQIGDMRQGTITEVYRACGKPNCRCANPGDPGHGPYYAFTRKVAGKTKTLQLRAGPSLFRIEGEVEAYRQFRGLCTELVKVNEAICQARTLGDEAASDEVKKNLVEIIQEEVAKEVEQLVSRLLRERQKFGQLDMEATEMAVRSSTHQAGGVVLEKLVNLDGGGYRGPRIDCGQGHLAEFVDYRSKIVITVLTPIQIRRAYYHCSACERGVIPKDKELDIVKTSCSPGVRRLMGHVGGKEAFEEGRQDLEELAGILVKTKQVERVSERLGEQIEVAAAAERECALGGKLLPFASVPTMYIAIDGTGVPVVPRETLGRAGKDETGRAKTREVKLGCVFTQTSVDNKGRPLRDDESTTYVGAIETADDFGKRNLRRGSPPRTAPCRPSRCPW